MRYGRRDYRIFRHSKRLNFFPTFLAATGEVLQIISGIRYDALLMTRFGRNPSRTTPTRKFRAQKPFAARPDPTGLIRNRRCAGDGIHALQMSTPFFSDEKTLRQSNCKRSCFSRDFALNSAHAPAPTTSGEA
jgi:hypothetical protein